MICLNKIYYILQSQIPMQRITSKPFITCARHSKSTTLQFILEKMINNFLSAQRRETHQNAPMVVTILTDILSETCNETDVVKVLLNTTTITLFEHAMMVDEKLASRTMIFDFFAALFKSPAYLSSLEIRYFFKPIYFILARQMIFGYFYLQSCICYCN